MHTPDHVPPPPSQWAVPSPALARPTRCSSTQPPDPPVVGAGRDAVAWLFALALDGDAAAELELGRRAFPWAPGGDGAATDLEALRAYLALTQADYERHRDAPRPRPDARRAGDS